MRRRDDLIPPKHNTAKKVITITRSSSSSGYQQDDDYNIGSTGYQSQNFDSNNTSMYSSPTSPTTSYQSYSTAPSPTTSKSLIASSNGYSNGSPTYGGASADSHIGSIKKDYFKQARAQNQSSPTVPIQQWFYQVLSDMLRYIYTSISTISGGKQESEWNQPALQIDNETRERLESFKQHVTVPYDTKDEKHEKELMRLWSLCMPNVELTHRISQQWKQVGFQGTDPATDFRGCGIFGLRNVLYFATRYPDQFQKMFQKMLHTPTSYPFVIAGLNITMMLFDILGFGLNAKKATNLAAKKQFLLLLLGDKNSERPRWGVDNNDDLSTPTSATSTEDDWAWNEEEEEETPVRSKGKKKQTEGVLLDFGDGSGTSAETIEEAKPKKTVKKPKKKKKPVKVSRAVAKISLFEEVYCCAWRILDKEWYLANATYFNFPTILAKTMSRIEDLLETEFNSMEDVLTYNKSGRT